MRAETKSETEVSVRRGLRRLRQRRHDQRVARVDRHHRCAHAESRYCRADESREGNRIVVELLSQPHLADTEVVRAGGLGDHVIDHIDGLRIGKEHDSSRHIPTNRDTEADYSDLLGLIGSLAL